MVGQPPFVDDDPMGIYQQILNGKLNFPRFIERATQSRTQVVVAFVEDPLFLFLERE